MLDRSSPIETIYLWRTGAGSSGRSLRLRLADGQRVGQNDGPGSAELAFRAVLLPIDRRAAIVGFSITEVSGEMRDGELADIPALLDSLCGADVEHPDVAVQTEEGISVSVFADGLTVIEDVESGELEPHWATIPHREDIVAVIAAVTEGDTSRAMSLVSWQPGYGPGHG